MNRTSWTKKKIQESQSRIKNHLASLFDNRDSEERLDYILAQIRKLDESLDDQEMLDRYVYIMSAVVQHQHSGVAGRAEIKKLANLAFAILKAQNIHPGRSELSFVHSDVHFLLSQCYRQWGEHTAAAWECEMAAHLSESERDEVEQYRIYLRANRAFRLGQANRALELFLKVESINLHNDYGRRSRLERIRALRLSQQLDECAALIENSSSLPFAETEKAAVNWERVCLDCILSKELRPMLTAIRVKDTEHYQGYFLLEAFFWNRAMSTKSNPSEILKMNTLYRKSGFDFSKSKEFLDQGRHLEYLYDSGISREIRLEKAGELFEECQRLFSIDQELLAMAALIRWLAFIKAPDLASLVLGRFQTLSLSLTNGRSSDALGVCGDLFGRNWSA